MIHPDIGDHRMNVIEYATRDDLPKATELRRRMKAIHAIAIAAIKTERGISAGKRRELVNALNKELKGL